MQYHTVQSHCFTVMLHIWSSTYNEDIVDNLKLPPFLYVNSEQLAALRRSFSSGEKAGAGDMLQTDYCKDTTEHQLDRDVELELSVLDVVPQDNSQQSEVQWRLSVSDWLISLLTDWLIDWLASVSYKGWSGICKVVEYCNIWICNVVSWLHQICFPCLLSPSDFFSGCLRSPWSWESPTSSPLPAVNPRGHRQTSCQQTRWKLNCWRRWPSGELGQQLASTDVWQRETSKH